MTGTTVETRPDGVLVISVDDVLSADDVRRYLDTMSGMVEAGAPFAMITRYRAGRPRKDAEGHRLESDWLAAHKARLRGRLVAVALVHDGGPVRRALERVAMSGAGRRLFGCQCRPFADLDEAIAWSSALVAAT